MLQRKTFRKTVTLPFCRSGHGGCKTVKPCWKEQSGKVKSVSRPRRLSWYFLSDPDEDPDGEEEGNEARRSGPLKVTQPLNSRAKCLGEKEDEVERMEGTGGKGGERRWHLPV